MMKGLTLNDLNFYYSFIKEKVEKFLNDKNLKEEQYNLIFDKLVQNTLKAEIKDLDLKNKIDRLRELNRFQ